MKRSYLLLPLILCVNTSTADFYVVSDVDYKNNTQERPVLPVVNDENCKIENIKKIEDKAAQQEFAGLCFRRGDFVKSKPIAW